MEAIERLRLKEPKAAATLERAIAALVERALALHELDGSANLRLAYGIHRGRLSEIAWDPDEKFRP